MSKGGINRLFCTAVCILLLANCNGTVVDTQPVALPDMACQPEDVTADPPFTLGQTSTQVPPTAYLYDQIEEYYSVILVESALTNTMITCDIFEMADEASAIAMHERTCAIDMEEAESPEIGEDVCALEETGFRLVSFRQGKLVISIIGDNNGYMVDEFALAVNGRYLSLSNHRN